MAVEGGRRGEQSIDIGWSIEKYRNKECGNRGLKIEIIGT